MRVSKIRCVFNQFFLQTSFLFQINELPLLNTTIINVWFWHLSAVLKCSCEGDAYVSLSLN